MSLDVETKPDERGLEVPVRFRMNERTIDVAKLVDEWRGKDHRYFKLLGSNGNLYILRLDEAKGEWEITLFESPRAKLVSKGVS